MDPKLIADAKKVMQQFESLIALSEALTRTPGLEREIEALERKRDSIRTEITQVQDDMKRVWAEREKALKDSAAIVEESKTNRTKAKAWAKELLDATNIEAEKLVVDARAKVVKILSDSEAARETLKTLERELDSVRSLRDELQAEIEGLRTRFA